MTILSDLIGSTFIGPQGPQATISVGTTTAINPNVNPSVANGGTASAAILNFSLPRAPTVGLGTTSVVNPNVSPSITPTTTNGDLTLGFNLPRAPSITIGTITTGAAGSSASVVNVGSNGDITLNFTIPRGDQGIQGIQGIQGPTGPQGTNAVIRGVVASFANLPGTGTLGDLYIALDTGIGWLWTGSAWTNAGSIRGPQGVAGDVSVGKAIMLSMIFN